MQKLPFNNIKLEYLLENVKSIFAALERPLVHELLWALAPVIPFINWSSSIFRRGWAFCFCSSCWDAFSLPYSSDQVTVARSQCVVFWQRPLITLSNWCDAVYTDGVWKAFIVESCTEWGTYTASEWDEVCTCDCSCASEMHGVSVLREQRAF